MNYGLEEKTKSKSKLIQEQRFVTWFVTFSNCVTKQNKSFNKCGEFQPNRLGRKSLKMVSKF